MSSRNKTDVKKLFEFWCEVVCAQDGDSRAGAGIPEGIIVESFPENFRDTKTIADLPAFAFPCNFKSESVLFYSFVLTTVDSKFRYGFCRYDPKSDSVMVMITYLPWHETFLGLLLVLADLRRTGNAEFSKFLAEIYNCGVPNPGSNVKVYYNDGKSYFPFERPLCFQLPSIASNKNLMLYYNFVEAKHMIAVFAAMLTERRIIFTSQHLDRLSSCVQAANGFLYPMVWQNIFIPLMPMKLKDYLCAPMPYLIGVPKMVYKTMTPDELGDVVILDCDTKTFESPYDDVHEMPAEIISHLKKQFSHPSELVGDRVSKIFLGVLVELIGGYRDAVEFRESGKTFNRERFIESRPSNLRPFLAKIMGLQMFQQFIDERMDMLNAGLGLSDEFEMETVRYAEKIRKRSSNTILKNLKDKTNPAVKSAVKSVKEGSRGVKSAYKDFKSKIREITPTNSTQFRSHLASNSQHDRMDGYTVNSKTIGGYHSAPSSPVFTKRVGGEVSHATAGGFQYASPKEINGAAQSMRRAPPLAVSSSSAHIHPNGYASATNGITHHHNHLAASPTISPASSLCSSEMNLSQELQNHPLFKTPAVDRSSLRSLQPQHLQVSQSQMSAGSSLHSVAPSCSSQPENTMNDLISLDDSNNTSFDLEDFDPLNQNAKPLPLGNCRSSNRFGAGVSGSAGISNISSSNKKSTTLPSGTSTSVMTASTSISNPAYTYFTPQHMPPSQKPPPLPKSVPPPMPPRDEDFELLRKYGLDQFTLTTASKASASNGSVVKQPATGMSTWTTFD